jgi:hypothetical protein
MTISRYDTVLKKEDIAPSLKVPLIVGEAAVSLN